MTFGDAVLSSLFDVVNLVLWSVGRVIVVVVAIRVERALR